MHAPVRLHTHQAVRNFRASASGVWIAPALGVSLQLETFVVGPLPNNLYLLRDDQAREMVVIDPSIESQIALERARALQAEGFRLTQIWNTHGHFDHIFDNAVWQAAFEAPISMHRDDEFWRERLREQALWLQLPAPQIVATNTFFEDGQIVSVGNHSAKVLHTPGHSPGSVSFFFEAEKLCVSGDVLFRGSVGRTDLPGCSSPALRQSLQILTALPPATRILPGHGEATTIEAEKQDNPYCRFTFRAPDEN